MNAIDGLNNIMKVNASINCASKSRKWKVEKTLGVVGRWKSKNMKRYAVGGIVIAHLVVN